MNLHSNTGSRKRGIFTIYTHDNYSKKTKKFAK